MSALYRYQVVTVDSPSPDLPANPVDIVSDVDTFWQLALLKQSVREWSAAALNKPVYVIYRGDPAGMCMLPYLVFHRGSFRSL